MNDKNTPLERTHLLNHPFLRMLVLASLIGAMIYWSMHSSEQSSPQAPKETHPQPAGRHECQSESERNFSEINARLREVTSDLGLDFHHFVGPLGTYFMPESIGAGGAFADFDGDGKLDLYLVNSGVSPNSVRADRPTVPVRNCLYLQNSDGRFVDITDSSGADDRGYGVGCAAGDVDNDGDIDLYVTNYGADQLYLNRGDATFENVTKLAGIEQNEWGTSVSFVDYNRDGWLDIFVATYCRDPEHEFSIACGFHDGMVSYCGPHKFQPTFDRLLRNDGMIKTGNGDQSIHFTDVTESSGLNQAPTYGFGVVCFDASRDGWPDLFVANDGEPNRLWINQQDGSFREEAASYGVAMNRAGGSEAGMGVTIGDYDRNGGFDLLLSHLSLESSTLYQKSDSLYFEDVTENSGLDRLSWKHTGWGIALVDLNHDGNLDVPVANGLVVPCHSGFPFHGEDRFQQRVETIENEAEYWLDYADSNQLFLGQESGLLTDAAELGGEFTGSLESSRALLTGDYDDDGDQDILITNCGGKARLFRNDLTKLGNWLMLQVHDPKLKRDALGAEITVTAGNAKYREIVSPGEGYLSSNDPRVHFGLGEAESYDAIEVLWPDGPVEEAREIFPAGKTNQILILKRGSGKR